MRTVPLDWGVFALTVIPLAQILLVALLSRYTDREDEGPVRPARLGYATYPFSTVAPVTVPEERGGDGTTVAPSGGCPRCHEPTDPAYDYCRHCVRRVR